MPDSPTAATPPARRALAVAVGLFAAWQLVFLPAANLIHFVPLRARGQAEGNLHQRRGEFTSAELFQRAAERGAGVLDAWSGVSGQEQGWSLFAPGLPPYSVFPAAEFHFPDGTSETLLSDFEPADKHEPPPRAPLLSDRLFNNEAYLVFPVCYVPPEGIARPGSPAELAALREQYRRLPDAVRALRGPIRAWLAWKARQYAEAHPDRGTPAAVILKHRYIPTPKPGEPADWSRPAVERPFVRWRPADDSLEAYDALSGRFVPLEAWP